MARPRREVRGAGQRLIVGVVALLVCAGCAAPDEARRDDHPLGAVGRPPYLCGGVLSRPSASIVTGHRNVQDSGGLRAGEVGVCNVLPGSGERTPPGRGERRVMITMDITPARSRQEVSVHVREGIAHAPGARRLPPDITGPGYVAFADSSGRQATVVWFVAGQRLHLEIRESAQGRDPRSDAVALLRQVAARLDVASR